MPAEKKDSAATNRLLDLLRSQQAGKSTTEGNVSGTVDANALTESSPVTPETPASGNSVVSSSIVPDIIEDSLPPDSPSSQAVTSEEIMAKLGRIGKPEQQSSEEKPDLESLVEGSEDEKKPEQEVVVPVESSESPEKSVAGEKEVAPEKEKAPEKQPDNLSPAESQQDLHEPRIDPAFFQKQQDVKPPNKVLDILYEFSNWALGVRRKITIQCTSDLIRVMTMRSVGNRNIIDKLEEYKLPYETENQKITHRDDLLIYFLSTLDRKVWKKDTMFRTYSSQIETHTKVFKAPPVKGKEFTELINWSAKKNLPFSSENITVDYEVLNSEKGELKKNIIIGIGNNETILQLSNLYKKHKYDLQSVATIPYLDWQTFVHCYPDRLRGCIAIIHMNKNETTITMVKSGRMEFNREIPVGVKDYQKALIQRVMVGNESVTITEEMSFDYLMKYGIPVDTDKDIPDTGISLYKISIFLRPVIERMTSEINRSLDYFKKQVADVECQEIYITGPGASIPNLVEVFEGQLSRSTEHLNPLRQGDFEFAEPGTVDYQLIPAYATNFELALKNSTGINLLPPARKQHFKYKILNKFALFIASILIPLYTILGYFAYRETELMEQNVASMNQQWQKLSEKSQEYFIMLDDLQYLGNYWRYLSNDQINSNNQIMLLKLISSEIPDNIKVTSLIFRPATTQEDGKTIKQGAHIDRIAMSGFVNAHAGVADIQLTNFIMRLESLNIFTSIDREVQGNPSSDDTRLFFTLKMGISI